MKGGTITFAVVLSFIFFLPHAFGDEGDYAQAEPFYAEQKRKLDEMGQQLETARQTGQMSQADYEEAQKGLAETRKFIETEGKNLGPEMEKARQMAEPIIAAHKACQNLQEDPQAYQECVQSKIK